MATQSNVAEYVCIIALGFNLERLVNNCQELVSFSFRYLTFEEACIARADRFVVRAFLARAIVPTFSTRRRESEVKAR